MADRRQIDTGERDDVTEQRLDEGAGAVAWGVLALIIAVIVLAALTLPLTAHGLLR